jgi:hypothetical protein
MDATVHCCGMFSPVHISLNMSVRKVITFFPPYLSSYVGIPPGPPVLFLYFKALFTPSSPGSFLLHFVLGWIIYTLFSFPVAAPYNETASGLVQQILLLHLLIYFT